MQELDNSDFIQNVALARERNSDYKEVILFIDESRSFLCEPTHECLNGCYGAELRLYGTMHGPYSQEWGKGPEPLYGEPEEARHIDFFECKFLRDTFLSSGRRPAARRSTSAARVVSQTGRVVEQAHFPPAWCLM